MAGKAEADPEQVLVALRRWLEAREALRWETHPHDVLAELELIEKRLRPVDPPPEENVQELEFKYPEPHWTPWLADTDPSIYTP